MGDLSIRNQVVENPKAGQYEVLDVSAKNVDAIAACTALRGESTWEFLDFPNTTAREGPDIYTPTAMVLIRGDVDRRILARLAAVVFAQIGKPVLIANSATESTGYTVRLSKDPNHQTGLKMGFTADLLADVRRTREFTLTVP